MMTSRRRASAGVRLALGAIAGLLAAMPFVSGPGTTRAEAAVWAFEETFDGAPGAPLNFSSARWDIVAGSNDLDAIVDGQTVEGVAGGGIIEAGHGADCGAPIGRGELNNHILIPGSDPHTFQHNTRPKLSYVCNHHMMTTVKSGYGVVSLMARQPFDWAGRTGTFEIDVNPYAFGREWWDVYFVPEDDMLLEIVMRDEGGTGEQLPRRGVKFSFRDGNPAVAVINNYGIVSDQGTWQKFQDEFPTDPALTDPRIRRTFRFQLSQTGWGFAVQKADGSMWEFSGTFPQPLSFTRALARIEHHAYNPTKDGIFGAPWSQFTYHWDNVRFDGPVVASTPAYEPGPHFVDLMRSPDPNFVSPPVRINVPSSQTQNALLTGHIASMLNFDGVDPQNASHWRQFRLNGGPWQDILLVKNASAGERSWSTFRNPLTGVVQGENRIEFRYPTRPAQATWHWNGYRVKDLEIQLRGAAFVPPAPPPATPTPTAAPPVPTVAPSPTAAPTVPPTTAPSAQPSAVPTALPTTAPTAQPSGAPAPSQPAPTNVALPSPAPTAVPTTPPSGITIRLPIVGPITIPLPGSTQAPVATAAPQPTAPASNPAMTAPTPTPQAAVTQPTKPPAAVAAPNVTPSANTTGAPQAAAQRPPVAVPDAATAAKAPTNAFERTLAKTQAAASEAWGIMTTFADQWSALLWLIGALIALPVLRRLALSVGARLRR
jgi:hypothetical protein